MPLRRAEPVITCAQLRFVSFPYSRPKSDHDLSISVGFRGQPKMNGQWPDPRLAPGGLFLLGILKSGPTNCPIRLCPIAIDSLDNGINCTSWLALEPYA